MERIERLTDLDFGSLRAVDPLGGQQAGFGGIVIEGLQDIRLGH